MGQSQSKKNHPPGVPWWIERAKSPSVAVAYAVPHRVLPQLLRPLITAHITATQITASSVKQVAPCVASLRAPFGSVEIKTAGVRQLHVLRDLRSLTELDLEMWSNVFDDESFKHIAACPHLTDLSLASFTFAPRSEGPVHGLVHLLSMRTLRVLRLNRCTVHESAVRVVADIPGIETLSFAFTSVSAAHMKPLAKMSALIDLNLAHCSNIDAEAIRCLSKCRGLMALDLSGCTAVDSEALVAVAEISTLTSLDVGTLKDIDVVAMGALSSKLGLLEHLRLARCDTMIAAAVAMVGRMTKLSSLDLSFCKALSADVLECIAEVPLQELTVTHTWLEPEHVAMVAQMDLLTTLDLHSVNFRVNDLSPLKRLRWLSALNLSRSNITDVGMASVATIARLTTLSVYHCNITDAGIEAISRLTDLSVLDVGVAPRTRLEHLQALPRLEVLFFLQPGCDHRRDQRVPPPLRCSLREVTASWEEVLHARDGSR